MNQVHASGLMLRDLPCPVCHRAGNMQVELGITRQTVPATTEEEGVFTTRLWPVAETGVLSLLCICGARFHFVMTSMEIDGAMRARYDDDQQEQQDRENRTALDVVVKDKYTGPLRAPVNTQGKKSDDTSVPSKQES